MTDNPPRKPTDAAEPIAAQLLDALTPLPVAAPQREAMRQGLLTKVADSLASHTGLLTVRTRHGVWRDLKSGVRYKTLWDGPRGGSVLIDFAAGASLMPHRHNWLEEGIVLRGELTMDDLRLGPFDYHVSPAGSRHGAIHSETGALAFLRGTSLGDTPGVIREILGGLLPGADRSQSCYLNSAADWRELAPGIEQWVLYRDGELEASYYRFAPGSRISGHAHPIDEECILLSGDLYLGDILLLPGDYQMAPAGSRHGNAESESGALLYVRGAPCERQNIG
ncbi:hypothetical protein BJL95_14290 [Methylomonas sp. LWB]|uniref:cupin domain-containing protein n=1 Tax=Methylomonas sp. LWB TaxID=1905845 RepID=UPI0008D9B0EA|nr:cupin domain-containing protein [Methylomonas sp. LWB]OHX38293.1 hypothetical protein BJL95_14290 [Methylomonas sp. LWB]